MRRRDFIAGAAAASTIGRAHAQQKAKVPRLAAVLTAEPVTDLSETGTLPGFSAFFQRLRQLGYIEGQNLAVDRWSGEGRTEHFAKLAGDIVRSDPDLIFIAGDRLMRELKAATDTIPVVAILGDPVAQGIVTSLARPDGNITGVTVVAGVEINGKALELLRELVPAASRVGWLASRRTWEGPYASAIREAAQRINITLVGPPLEAPFQEAEYRRVFSAMAQESADGLVVFGQPENLANRRLIVDLANEARLPSMYAYPDFAEVGGLISYGVDLPEIGRHAADQVDQLLKGAKPGDIPFYQPTKFLLAVNLKTAKALGITVPPTLLIAADEVIE